MKQNNWFDPFYIQENLTEEETQIQKNVRDFCNKELRPNVVSNNLKNSFDKTAKKIIINTNRVWWAQ